MSAPNSYSRHSLVTVLGVVALGLFALNFHTALSNNWDEWSDQRRFCRTKAEAIHVAPPIPPVPPVPPVPAVALPGPEFEVDVQVDMEEFEREIRHMEREIRKMEVEIRAEAAREAQRQIVLRTKDAAVAIIR